MQDMSISFKRPHNRSSSHHITLHHVTSRQVMSPYVRSCHLTSCHVMSHQITSHHITFHYIMSCHVRSCHVMSCHVRSRQVMSSHVTIMLSNRIYSSAKSIASTGLAADATELSSSLSSSYVENAGASSASLALTFIKLLDMMPLSFI